MKIQGKKYVDISKVDVGPITSLEAKSIITKYHYSHAWTMCVYAFGIYYKKMLIGCIVYGSPIGRLVNGSITKTFNIEKYTLLELTRLWIADGFGTNIESYTIGQSFKLLKKYGVDILISYSDPEQKHLGKIYQATNWYYQGSIGQNDLWYIIKGKKLYSRTVSSRYGTRSKIALKELGIKFETIPDKAKLRYLYILNKKIKKKILSDLKHPILEYPK